MTDEQFAELLAVIGLANDTTVLRSDMESLLTTDFRRVDVVRWIESRVATIDRTPREWDRARMPK